MNLIKRFEKCGIIPVVALDRIEDALPLAKALIDGGIDVCEITFRTDCAEEAMELISREYPEMLVGAGTVLNEEQVVKAYEAGAKFIVSPGFNKEVVEKTKELGMLSLPGAVTPTEITALINEGLDVVKFFPAGNYGGLKTLKSLAGPFNKIKFMPTGGVGIDNLEEFLNFDKIIAVGGSWICKNELITEGKFDEITRLCKEAKEVHKKVRG